MRNSTKLMPILAAVLLLACGSEGETRQGAALGSAPAYEFKLTSLDGTPVSLSDYRGKALIVDVWDTWCPPCKKGIPEFIELYNQYQSKGLEILGVAGGRFGVESVKQFVSEYGIPYDNALVTEDFVTGFGGIRGIPTTFVIDTQGNLYRKYVGYTSKAIFEADVKAVLAL